MSKPTNQRKVLVTAALPYSNGRLHVGHIAGAYLPSDIYVRYLRLAGAEVRFVCGSDDHGVAIMLTAEKEGKTPAEVAKFYGEKQQRDLLGLGISLDIYSSTSRNSYHKQASQEFFLKVYERGFFEKKSTRQFYDASREMFLPDRFVKGTCTYCETLEQNGDQCENCGKMLDVDSLRDARSVMSGNPATVKETVHWFLDVTSFEQAVSNWVDTAVLRDHTRNYVRGLLGMGLVKRSMTRDISWGIPLPIQDPDAAGKVLYVWFDAPIGYISNTAELCQQLDGDSERYNDWWRSPETEIYHFIGEDNTIFHCVIWIAMLQAESTFQLPRGVIVNNFLNIQFPDRESEKISKSRGTAVWIEDYLSEGGSSDVLRYYLTSIAPERARTVYKPDDLVQRNNSELANILGNFVHRIVSFTIKYEGPQIPAIDPAKLTQTDHNFLALFETCHITLTKQLEEFAFKQGLEGLMDFARACNKYADEKAPWATRKTDLETTRVTLALCLQAIHFLGVCFAPFLPETSAKILRLMNQDPESTRWMDALTPPPAGALLNEPQILFQKIETEEK